MPVETPARRAATARAGARVTARGALAPSVLPLGRRSPRGRLRWYLVQVPEGRERTTAERLLSIVPHEVLEDAFCPSKELWMKRDGRWFVTCKLMYPGFVFAASCDARQLGKELARLSFPAELVGAREHACFPLADDARLWLERAMDSSHVIRSSTGSIENGVLHVTSGPLVGQEAALVRVDRHKRYALVHVGDVAGGFTASLPLDIPTKS